MTTGAGRPVDRGSWAREDTRDDRALMSAHIAGDPHAFNEIVRRHRDRLWAVALRTTCDREEAADALQDALISAFRRAQTFRGDAQLTTWLHRIVVNACLDRMRRRNARPTSPLPETEDRDDQLAADDQTDSVAEVSERRADVMAALARLSEDQRAALVLVDMEGYSVDEAATLLDCAPGTVKSRCSRGRLKLVPLLTQYRSGPAPNPDPPGSRFDLDGGNRAGSEHVRPVPRPDEPHAPPRAETEGRTP